MINWEKEVVSNRYHCNVCGAKVVDEKHEPDEKVVFFLRNDKGYCKKCGNKLCRKGK